jgi:hypothetical protein
VQFQIEAPRVRSAIVIYVLFENTDPWLLPRSGEKTEMPLYLQFSEAWKSNVSYNVAVERESEMPWQTTKMSLPKGIPVVHTI